MRLSILVSSFLVAGLSLAASPAKTLEQIHVKEIKQFANLMPTIGPESRPVQTHIAFEVFSGGCTRPEDFRVSVTRTRSSQTLTISRIRPDLCEAYMPHTTIELDTEELALSSQVPLFIANPVYANESVVY